MAYPDILCIDSAMEAWCSIVFIRTRTGFGAHVLICTVLTCHSTNLFQYLNYPWASMSNHILVALRLFLFGSLLDGPYIPYSCSFSMTFSYPRSYSYASNG